MKRRNYAAAFLAIAATVLTVIGCSAKFDDKTAKLYVEGTLDVIFKNEISEELADLTDGGRAALEAQYNEIIASMASEYEAAGGAAELVDDYTNVYKDLFKACTYTVGDAVLGEDGNYTVTVAIEPLNLPIEEIQQEANVLFEKNLFGGMTDQEDLYYEHYKFMIAKFREIADNPSYGETTTVDVHVVKVGDSPYEILGDDLVAVTNAVFSE